MNTRERAREQECAKEFWQSLDHAARWQLGDDLVLGCFDWNDWGFEKRPSSVFLNEVDYQRVLWESSDETL